MSEEIEILKQIRDETAGMRKDTNYELRRMADRLEKLSTKLEKM